MTSDINELAKRFVRPSPPLAPLQQPEPHEHRPLHYLGVALLAAGVVAFILGALAVAPRCKPGHELTIGGAIRIAGCQQGGPP